MLNFAVRRKRPKRVRKNTDLANPFFSTTALPVRFWY